MQVAYVGIGSNLGDRWAHLSAGARRLAEAPSSGSAAVSPVYESEAHTRSDQEEAPDFLNAVLRLETDWTPLQLLDFAQMVERDRGRESSRQGASGESRRDRGEDSNEDPDRDTDAVTAPYTGSDASGDEQEWAPRSLDLDILVFGELSCRTPRLTVPHARLDERRFVLRPLVDLDPDLWIPDPFEATARSLLARCPDTHRLRRCEREISLSGSA